MQGQALKAAPVWVPVKPQAHSGCSGLPRPSLVQERGAVPVSHTNIQRATVSQRKPAGTDYIHMQKTAEIVLLTTLTWKRIYTEKKNIFQFKRRKTLKYSQLRDFSSQWMAASRWQHPKLPHQSAACACTEFPHLGMTEKQWPTGFIYVYLYTMGGYHQYRLHVSAGNWFPRRKLLLIPCRLLPPSRVHTRDRDRAMAQVIHTHMQ